MLNISYYDGVKYHRMDFINRDKDFYGNGVVQLTHFPFTLPTPNNMSINIGLGAAWVDGYRIENDATMTLTAPTADSTNPRIDIVQVGHDDINSQAVLTIKKGVAAGTPIEPDADPNYVKLFAITIPANAISIIVGNIADRRALVPLNVSGTQLSMAGAAGTAQKNTFSDTQTFLKGTAPISIPNQTILPAVGPAGTMCVVNNMWYQSDGTNWIAMAPPPPPAASTTVAGIVELTDSVISTSVTTAATPKAVKNANDNASAKYTKPSLGVPKTDLESAVQTSLGKADAAETPTGSQAKADTVQTNLTTHTTSYMPHDSGLNSYASVIDINNIYTVVTYKRADTTIYLKSTLSNPDVNGRYQTVTWLFYAVDGTTLALTKTWTITYDANGLITIKAVV